MRVCVYELVHGPNHVQNVHLCSSHRGLRVFQHPHQHLTTQMAEWNSWYSHTHTATHTESITSLFRRSRLSPCINLPVNASVAYAVAEEDGGEGRGEDEWRSERSGLLTSLKHLNEKPKPFPWITSLIGKMGFWQFTFGSSEPSSVSPLVLESLITLFPLLRLHESKLGAAKEEAVEATKACWCRRCSKAWVSSPGDVVSQPYCVASRFRERRNVIRDNSASLKGPRWYLDWALA